LLQSSGQQLQQLHLRQLGMAGETWALSLLKVQQKDSDLIPDPTPDFDVEDAQIHISIEDLAGRFNLNALLIEGQTDQVTLKRWARLLALLELPDLQLEQVGALRELSQLRLLPGVDGERLRRLEPWVALLPASAALNINTAPVAPALNGAMAERSGFYPRPVVIRQGLEQPRLGHRQPLVPDHGPGDSGAEPSAFGH
jgi:general secretion pathway protein K